MRYIHVPIAYSGLSREQEIRIASAISGAEGPLYLHCHHGKHRGPAAAATALVCLGEITPDDRSRRALDLQYSTLGTWPVRLAQNSSRSTRVPNTSAHE